MNQQTAKDIASLINLRNNLPEPVNEHDVLNGSYFFLETDDLTEEGKVKKKETKNRYYEPREIICCVRAKRLSFFSYELKHLSVNPKFEGQGFGSMMIKLVEENAIFKNVPILMSTTNVQNDRMNHLFTKYDYLNIGRFTNSKTNHICLIWQKTLKLD